MSKGQRVGYRRVSSADQSTERQLEGVQLDKEFEDKASGKDTNRPGLAKAIEYVRHGDMLIIHSLDRLARNTEDLLSTVRTLNENGVVVRFEKENLTFSGNTADPMAALMMTMLAAFATFERQLIRERQREGIALAKTRGIYVGRKPSLTDEQVAQVKARVAAGERKVDVARAFGVSRETLYAYLRPRRKAEAVELTGVAVV